MDSKAIETLADKTYEALPQFVPALPSFKIGLAVGLIVFVLGAITCWNDREENKFSEDPIERTRWMFVLMLTIYISSLTTDFVKDKHYAYVSVVINKQHYANVSWLKEYMKAIRG